MNKKLYKSRRNRSICGVCGGSGLLVYIIAALILPDEDEL